MAIKDSYGEDEDVKTAFNSSIDIIQRISKLKYSLHSNLIFDNLSMAFNILREYITAINFKITDEQRKEIYEFEMELKEDISKAEEMYEHNGLKYYRFPKIRADVKERLIELARVLGQVEYQTGMGMLDKDDPRFALVSGY